MAVKAGVTAPEVGWAAREGWVQRAAGWGVAVVREDAAAGAAASVAARAAARLWEDFTYAYGCGT